MRIASIYACMPVREAEMIEKYFLLPGITVLPLLFQRSTLKPGTPEIGKINNFLVHFRWHLFTENAPQKKQEIAFLRT